MAKKKNNPTFVVTGLARLSYPHLFEKYAFEEEKPTYNVTLLIPKSDKKTIGEINSAIQAAFEEGGKDKFGNLPLNSMKIEKPLKDGDEKVAEKPEAVEYKDMYYIKAKSTVKPNVVDRDLNPIIDTDEVYAGCWARASLRFYPYNNVAKGVGVMLNNVQKWKDDDAFGGKPTDPEDDFNDDFEDDDLPFERGTQRYDDSLD